MAADYGNLGDVAITYAQKQYLQEKFPDYAVVEIYAASTLLIIRSIKKQIHPDDIITVVGGGNMGDMYGDIELLRLLVVKSFPYNRIILFPQTIYYGNSDEARWLKRLSQKIYGRHKQLTMISRESTSYNTMKLLYPETDLKLTPDIVMGLDKRDGTQRMDIVTLCLRNDKEKSDNNKLVSSIMEECARRKLILEIYDTHIGHGRYSETEKYTELEKIWKQFRKSKFVVTDRLHGMIFAYITGTPAIVLPNSNFKVQACYQWLKNVKGIQLVSKVEDINYEYIDNGVDLIPDISERLNSIII